MKTRTGFVSNSSTTSFTCQVCRGVEEGSDCEDLGDVTCERGHVMHEEHLLEVPGAKQVRNKWGERYYPASQCPICQMQVLDIDDQRAFLLKVLGWTEDQILTEATARCTDYAGLLAFLGREIPKGDGVEECDEDEEDDEE